MTKQTFCYLRKTYSILVTLAGLGVISSTCDAATTTLNPVKDNTLIESSTGDVSNAVGPIFSGRTGGNGPGALRAAMAFDVAGSIPTGSIITGVELTLEVLKLNTSATDVYTLHRLNQDWGEGTSGSDSGSGDTATTGDATWIHTSFDTDTWSVPGGDFVNTPSGSQSIQGGGEFTWGSTSQMVADVQSWLDNPDSNFGWILIGNESSPASARKFGSREDANSAPVLSITFVPEPSSMALLLLGSLFGCAKARFARTQAV